MKEISCISNFILSFQWEINLTEVILFLTTVIKEKMCVRIIIKKNLLVVFQYNAKRCAGF